MSSWADASDDPVEPLEQAPAEYTGGGGVRPRLHLKPRSAKAAQDQAAAHASSAKSNPFGAAKPREEVLASKGIDATLVDKRVERKAHVPRLTADQDKQVEGLREELTELELKLREANEMELPEEDYREAAEAKRTELNDLVKGFHDINLKERTSKDDERRPERGHGGGGGGGGDAPRKFERPSERRRRLEQEREGGGGGHHRGGYDEGGGEDPYSSFGGNRSHGGGRGGGGDGGDRRHSGGRGGGGGGYNDRGSHGGGYNDRHDDRGSHGGGGYGDHDDQRGGGRRSGGGDNYAGDRYNF